MLQPKALQAQARHFLALSLSHCPDYFCIEKLPLLSLSTTPHEKACPGPITASILYIDEGLVIPQRPSHA